MAVPFNIPEEQSDVEVMLIQLQTLLNKLSVAIRHNQQNSAQSSSTSQRVRTTSSGRRSREAASTSTSDTASAILSNSTALPDLLNSLSIWASASESLASSPLTTIDISRAPRRRTSSESSCDETKISIMAKIKHGYQQDWNQVGVTLRKIADGFTPTILTQIDGVETTELLTADGCDGSVLSKIMPSSISSCSLMTAMICFVGWHIFRAR